MDEVRFPNPFKIGDVAVLSDHFWPRIDDFSHYHELCNGYQGVYIILRCDKKSVFISDDSDGWDHRRFKKLDRELTTLERIIYGIFE